MMVRRAVLAAILGAVLLGWAGLASAATTVASPANPDGNGLPSGGSSGDCVLNTTPGVGEWGACPGAGTGAPTTPTYITATADATLVNEVALGALATGLLINTTTTGVPTIYAGATCTNQVLRVLGASGAGTCVTITSAYVDSSIITSGGALGTPSSGTLTNATGLPISTGVSGLGTGVATFLATPSSTNLASAVTGETGSGALVFGTAPTVDAAVLTTSVLLPNGTAVPGTCSVGMIYFDNDATAGVNLYGCTATNTWTLLGDGGGGGGAVATDAIWDAAGDLAVGSGANTAVRLAKGNDGDVLTISGGNVAWGAGGSGMTHPQVMARASIGF